MHINENQPPAKTAVPSKQVTLKLAGQATGKSISITPATTAKEVLEQEVPKGRQMNLTLKPGQAPLGLQDHVFEFVPDGADLFAIPVSTFGQ